MAAPLLAEFVGGTPFLGFIAAVAFATILAVVAGLTLAAASAMSHDLFVSVKKGQASEHEQVKVAKIATVVFGMHRHGAGHPFKGQNVAFMVGLTFAIACSGNFPALLLSITWRKLSTAGAVAAIIVGSVTAFALIVSQPDGLGRHSQERACDLPDEEPGHLLDAAGVPRRLGRLAPDSRPRSAEEVRHGAGSHLPRCGRGIVERIRNGMQRELTRARSSGDDYVTAA